MRAVVAAPLLLLGACNAPAADDYVARVAVAEREAPSPPIAAPDTNGAVWAPEGRDANRLIYAKPGMAPFFSLACVLRRGEPMLTYTRFVAADPGAKAILALIGNRYVARWKIDATPGGGRVLWRGSTPAMVPEAGVFIGANRVEATVPGAGSLILNASALPGELVTRCRSLARPAMRASAPAATGVAPSPAQTDATDTGADPLPPSR